MFKKFIVSIMLAMASFTAFADQVIRINECKSLIISEPMINISSEGNNVTLNLNNFITEETHYTESECLKKILQDNVNAIGDSIDEVKEDMRQKIFEKKVQYQLLFTEKVSL